MPSKFSGCRQHGRVAHIKNEPSLYTNNNQYFCIYVVRDIFCIISELVPQFAAAVSFRCPVWLSFDCWWPKKLLNWNTELHYSLCTSTLYYKVGMNFVGEMVRRVRPRKVTKARSWPCTFKASITYFGDSWKVWRSGCVLHVWATTANPKGAWCASFSSQKFGYFRIYNT